MDKSYVDVHTLLLNIATGTDVVITDDILEDRLYYEGSVKWYFDGVAPLVNLRVANIAVQETRLVISAIAVASV